jgi:hypothetical protein
MNEMRPFLIGTLLSHAYIVVSHSLSVSGQDR